MPKSLAIAMAVQKKNKKPSKKMALGGAVEGPTRSGHPYDREPGQPAKKPDNKRLPDSETMIDQWSAGSPPARKPDDTRPPKDRYMANHFAEGGKVSPNQHEYMSEEEQDDALREGKPLSALYNPKPNPSPTPSQYASGGEVSDDDFAGSIADAIMARRAGKRMAEGGMVDLEANSEEVGRSPYDEENASAGNAEQYDLSQLSAQPEDSNEMGDGREDAQSDPHSMISKIRAHMKAKGR